MRDAFLLDPDIVFLNHGSFGACPAEVFEAYQRWQRELERNPVEFLGRRSAGLLRHARERLGNVLGAPADDLAFVTNATTGVNIVARSLCLQPGDEVLATDHEYGACDATWQRICREAGAHYTRVPIPLPFDSESWADRMMAATGPRTRAIFVSHITSTTALVFPVTDLCALARRKGICTLIDGAHAPGQIAVDLLTIGADFYTGNCHKWLCAPKGAAFLHVRPEHQAVIDATVVSWGYVAAEAAEGGHAGFDAYTGRTLLERRLQWQGTRDIAAQLAVTAAIDFQARHDWPSWQARCHAMVCDAMHRNRERNGLALVAPDTAYGQMATLPVKAIDAENLRRWLFERHRIEVPVTTHHGHVFVRLSVQVYNTQADVDALAGALAEAGV
jgi:isopenicillin-N epimerase